MRKLFESLKVNSSKSLSKLRNLSPNGKAVEEDASNCEFDSNLPFDRPQLYRGSTDSNSLASLSTATISTTASAVNPQSHYSLTSASTSVSTSVSVTTSSVHRLNSISTTTPDNDDNSRNSDDNKRNSLPTVSMASVISLEAKAAAAAVASANQSRTQYRMNSIRLDASSVATFKGKKNPQIIDALSIMHSGSFMLYIPNNSENYCVEWDKGWLSDDNSCIKWGNNDQSLFDIEDVWSINCCDSKDLLSLLKKINISSLESIGLKSLAIAIELRNYERIYLISDSFTNAYIWYRGIHALANPKSLTVESIPLTISYRLRLGNLSILDFVSTHQNTDLSYVASIDRKLPIITQQIQSLYYYVSKRCRQTTDLDISLTLQTRMLASRLAVIRTCRKEIDCCKANTQSMIIDRLRELCGCLEADWAAVLLKTAQIIPQS